VAIFGVIFLGERLSGLNWLGVGLIGAGALLVAIKSWSEKRAQALLVSTGIFRPADYG
jgi:drug/metabolite transporter (DMT)-like permease